MQRWIENGYIVLCEEGRAIYEHTLIAEKVLGRSLRVDEEIRHKNGVRSDNRISNLEILTIRDLSERESAFQSGMDPRKVFRNHKERGKKKFSYTYEDIASILDISEDAVRVAVNRKRFDPCDIKSIFEYKDQRDLQQKRLSTLEKFAHKFRG